MELVIAVLILVGIPITIYVVYAYNDLAGRWERLQGLWADIKSARSRRYGVAHAVSHHLGRATGHEQQIARLSTRRAGRGRRLISDNANGWANSHAVGTAGQGMATDVQSHDLENQLHLQLHREAEVYNGLIRSFPRCFVAEAFAFRRWRFGVGRPSNRPQHPNHRRRRRRH